MKAFLTRATTKLSVGWAAALLASASFMTMFLSLFRERLLNANFGVESIELDAYRAAFTVPDFMFILLVSGALSVTFIPVLNDRLGKGNRKSAWDLSSSLLNLLSIITLLASLLIIVFAEPIVTYLVAPGMSLEGQDLAISMMRIVAINPLLFAISAVFTSMQQAVGRFFFFALAPAIYNVGIIFGIVYITPEYGIQGVTIGVIIGAVAQVVLAAVGMIGLGFSYSPTINWRNQGFRKVLVMLPQRSLDQGIDYFNSLVEISIASRLIQGSINAWQVGFMLHWVPINLIGVAISTAAFPQMSERISQGRPDLFKKEFITLLRVIIWLAVPVCIVAFFGRGYLVRLLVAEGNSTISNILGLLVIAIFFRAVFHLVSRGFYAQQDTFTPLVVSIIAIAINIVLAIYLALPFGADYGVLGLAIAQSIMATTEVLILMFILTQRFPKMFKKSFFVALSKMALVGLATSVITYFLIQLFPLKITDVGFFSLVPKFGLIVALSFLCYILLSYLVGLREAAPIIDKASRVLFKPVKIS